MSCPAFRFVFGNLALVRLVGPWYLNPGTNVRNPANQPLFLNRFCTNFVALIGAKTNKLKKIVIFAKIDEDFLG